MPVSFNGPRSRATPNPAVITIAAICAAALGAGSSVAADEMIVTATKREAALQESAIAVTALDQHALEDRGILGLQDLQTAVPNLVFSNEQFALSTVSIRGIGRYAVGVTSDSGAGVHLDGAYLQYSSILESEFYDVERIEVLRGPQGTLYGRNTTAGVLNVITAAPAEQFSSALSVELGDYATRRATGHLNVPVGERLQLRLAGLWLDRDGLTHNTFADTHIDDRSLWSVRASARVQLGPDTEATLTHQRFREDDRRMRTSKQYCATDPRDFPLNLGCLPGFDIDTPGVVSSRGQLSGIMASTVDLSGGLLPGGLRLLPFDTDAFDGAPVPASGRRVHADFEPEYRVDESAWVLEIGHSTPRHAYTVVGSYQQIEFSAQTDLDWAVPTVTFTPNIPGLTGPDGALHTPADPSVSGYAFIRQYDSASYRADTHTVEVRVASDYGGAWDFLAGVFQMGSKTHDTFYDVHANTLAAFAPVDYHDGAPIAFFRSDAALYRLDTSAAFGELYYRVSDATRLAAGARYTHERKLLVDRQTLLNTPGLPEVPGVSNRPFLTGDYAFLAAFGITDPRFHGFGTAHPAAGEFNNPVPAYRRRSASWQEVTGRLGIEHDVDLPFADRTLLYANLARSYKSGGINPASLSNTFSETFDPEFVHSLEIGARSRLAGGRVSLHGTYFHYDYRDLQISKIVDRTSVNENVDARIQGLEFEALATLSPALRIDASAAVMHSRITGGNSVNPADPTNGDATWTAVKNPTGDVFLIPTPGSGRTFDEADCGRTLECAVVFQVNPVSATAAQAAGADTPTVLVPIGVPASLRGNRLPNAPRFNARLGVEYSIHMAGGYEIVPRIDYYYQSPFYYRVFNTRQDRIAAWDVVNVSTTLHAPGGDWDLRLFVRNATDGEHITGAFLADGALGGYTNVFLLEPRSMGARFTYRF